MTTTTDRRRTRRIAVVGVDGSGKSSVIEQLQALAPAGQGTFASITCPDFHTTKNAPLGALSRQLRAFTEACDEIGSPEAKALTMYLQMTLYGPVERFFLDAFEPAVLVCERHPLIETFVYGQLYSLLAASGWDGRAHEDALRAKVRDKDEHAFEAVLAWHAEQSRRLGDGLGLWDRFNDVATAVAAPLPRAVEDFARRYRTTLPEAVLWLDAPPGQAAARCAERSGGGIVEFHETPEFLGLLRQGYERVKSEFEQTFPAVGFHVVRTDDGVDLAESVRACVTEGRLFA